MARMRAAWCLSFILLVGCQAHHPPDDALSGRLRATVLATCVAMQVPEGDRPTGRALDDQVGLLAMRLSAERVTKVERGELDRSVVVEAYRAALQRRSERQVSSEPPRLLSFLVDQQAQWSTDQTLLAAALLTQYEQEARLAPPPADLAR